MTVNMTTRLMKAGMAAELRCPDGKWQQGCARGRPGIVVTRGGCALPIVNYIVAL